MIVISTKTMRPRHPQDFYPTPEAHVAAALAILPYGVEPARMLDPGAGLGPWGRCLHARWPHAQLVGAELSTEPPDPAYTAWRHGDFLAMPWYERFDLVAGNPPYKHAEAFVRRGLELLAPGGFLVYLLRLAFLEGQARHAGLYQEHPPLAVAVFGDRPSFTGNGRTDATAYAAFVWQLGYGGRTILSFVRSQRGGGSDA